MRKKQMRALRCEAARQADVASVYHDQACAVAARQCGVFYAATVEPSRAAVTSAAGEPVVVSSPPRNFVYVEKTFFTAHEKSVSACA